MLADLIQGVLVLVLSFALKALFNLIGFEMDPAVFNALVGAMALWIVSKLGLGIVENGIHSFRARFMSHG